MRHTLSAEFYPRFAPFADYDGLQLLQDIVRGMYELRTPTQARRFTDAHRAWLFSVTWQVANLARRCGR